jgi:hypothetical protein
MYNSGVTHVCKRKFEEKVRGKTSGDTILLNSLN